MTRSSSAPSAPTGTVHYLYDLDGHLMAEADGATGAVLRDYVWLPANDNGNAAPGGAFSDDLAITGADNDNTPPDLPLAVIEGVNTASPVTYQVHTDHLGRPMAMTDATKATVWSAAWTPWGEAHSLTGSAVNNLRFPGQYFLIETGHAYNWHRTYDPVSGRYMQPDPLRFVDGPSIYAYAGNSPVMSTDFKGLARTNYFLPFSRKGRRGRSGAGTQMCGDVISIYKLYDVDRLHGKTTCFYILMGNIRAGGPTITVKYSGNVGCPQTVVR